MEYRLMFTQEELSVINDCLMAGPYGQVAPVINSINGQIRAANASPAQGGAIEQGHPEAEQSR
jgi:hypothetical protein